MHQLQVSKNCWQLSNTGLPIFIKKQTESKTNTCFSRAFHCSVEFIVKLILLQLYCPLLSSILMASCCSSTPFTSAWLHARQTAPAIRPRCPSEYFCLAAAGSVLWLCCPNGSSNSLAQNVAFMHRSRKTLPPQAAYSCSPGAYQGDPLSSWTDLSLQC